MNNENAELIAELEKFSDHCSCNEDYQLATLIDRAIAALSQTQAEPVAYRYLYDASQWGEGRQTYSYDSNWNGQEPIAIQPLFAHPQPAAPELHPDTAKLVRDFSVALAQKLSDAEKKYGYSNRWKTESWAGECRQKLRDHIDKGDPRDVAAYCAFLWYHNESTALSQPAEPTNKESVAELTDARLTGLLFMDYGYLPTDEAIPVYVRMMRTAIAADRKLRVEPAHPSICIG